MKQRYIFIFASFLFAMSGIAARAQVTANFTYTFLQGNQCAPVFVTFTNTSTGATGGSQWTFQNGSPSSSPNTNPSVLFDSCGAHTVTLVATAANGSTSTHTVTINVACTPTAAFTATPNSGCPPLTACFTSQSTPGSGPASAMTYQWDFCDGTLSTAPNPCHNYTQPGCLCAKLVVTNQFGCTAYADSLNYVCVTPPPVAQIQSSNPQACGAPLIVSFSGLTSTPNPNTLGYVWSFPGGSASSLTSPTPTVTYTATGSYNVSLTVSVPNGCPNTVTLNNYVNIGTQSANFSLSPSAVCVGVPISATTSPAQGIGWSVSPTTGFTANSGYHGTTFGGTFSQAGTYTICLQDTFSGGCVVAPVCSTVVVSSNPTATFGVLGNQSTCQPPLNVTVSPLPPAGLTYAWSFPGGTPSNPTQQNPGVIHYNDCTGGPQDISLVVTNAAGCTASSTIVGAVNINCPVAAFVTSGFIPGHLCAPQTITFDASGSTGLGAGSTYTWNWNYDPANPNAGWSPAINTASTTHVFTTEGCYNVALTVHNAQGCSATTVVPQAVCVGTLPVTCFTADDSNICMHGIVHFTNCSTPQPDPLNPNPCFTQFWKFGDGGTSTAWEPTHVYTDTGHFKVTLILCDCSCCDTLVSLFKITVHPPKAHITTTVNCTQQYCITYHSGPLPADLYPPHWTFPGGTPSTSTDTIITVCYSPGPQTHQATLILHSAQWGCSDTAHVGNTILPAHAQFTVSPMQGCAPLHLTFTCASSGSIVYYYLYNNAACTGAPLSTLWSCNVNCLCPSPQTITNPGNYWIKELINNYQGCKDSMIVGPINVYGLTPSYTAVDTVGCAPLTSTFTSTTVANAYSTPATYSWNFGDGTPTTPPVAVASVTHTYLTNGTFHITLYVTDNNGCIDSISNHVVHINHPVADFNAQNTSLCIGTPASFFSFSTGNNLVYHWDFGDPASSVANDTSNIYNPTHNYTTVGSFTVCLHVTDSYGCKDSLCKPNYISTGNLTGGFTLSDTFSSCPPLTVIVTNTTQGTGNINYYWSFGDGVYADTVSPAHIYTEAGCFPVTMAASNSYGCVANDTFTCVHLLGATANVTASVNAGCGPLPVCFTATQSTSINFYWSPGDNSSIVGPDNTGQFCYTYTTPGTYIAQVLLTDTAGCAYFKTIDTILVTADTAAFTLTPQDLCGPGTVTFTDASQSLTGFLTWAWDFGDSATTALQSPTHYYADTGIYIVSLTATAIGGCTDTHTDTVRVTGAPHAVFNVVQSVLCEDTALAFQNSSTGYGSPIASYAWDFGDSASGAADTSSVPNPTHNYANPGTYDVHLTVVSANGCSDDTTVTITVNPNPIVALGPDVNICVGDSIQLQFAGSGMYDWEPNNGTINPNNVYNPIFNPTVTTTYTLTYTDANGCQGHDDIVVNVFTPPVANAGSDVQTYAGATINLNGLGGLFYYWTTNDASSVITNPSQQNTPATVYNAQTITLQVTDANGCIDTDQLQVTIVPCPTTSAGADTSICVGTSATLHGSATTLNPTTIIYDWISNPPGNYPNTASIVDYPTVTTSYYLSATDSITGCTRLDTVVVSIITVPTVVTGGAASVCLHDSVPLQVSGGTYYQWSPSTGLSATNVSNPMASPPSTTTYQIIVEDSGMCYQVHDSLIVTVKPLPPVNAGLDTTVCLNDAAHLLASGGVTYLWTPDSTLNNPNIANPLATPHVPATYTVVATDANNCSAADSVVVLLYPLPVADAGVDTSICIYDSIQLHASGGLTYLWTPGASVMTDTSQNPLANPTVTTTYTLTATDAHGCHADAQTVLTVFPLPPAYAGPDQEICTGTSALLTASGGVNYLWSPAALVNSPSSAQTIANPPTAQTFSVEVTDQHGCIKDTSVFVDVLFPFAVQFPHDTCLCYGASMQLHVMDTSARPHSYSWTPFIGILGAHDSSNVTIAPVVPLTYTVVVSDMHCFSDTGIVAICIQPTPQIEAGENKETLIGQPVQLYAQGTTGIFTWAPDSALSCNPCQNPTATPMITTQYTVTVTDSLGCTNKDSMTVFVICNNDVLYIPNAFTPDGDEINPMFRVFGTGIKQLNYLRIYNRWGEKVFESKDIEKGWDGTYNGKAQEAGVYVYYLEAVCTTGKTITRQGNITLLR